MTMSLILGLLIGIVIGITGAGGGILAVPALVFGLDWSMQQATPVALIAVAGSSALGALTAFKHNLVRYRAALLMACSGIPLTFLGLSIAQRVPSHYLLLLFACIIVFVAVRQIKQPQQLERMSTIQQLNAPCQVNPDSGRFMWNRKTALLLSATGATAGLMTGLLGVGGGFIIIPMLRKLTNLSLAATIATTLMIVALVGSGGIVSAILHGIRPPIDFTAYFTLSMMVGLSVGRLLAVRISERLTQLSFAAILLLVAASLFYKAALIVMA